MKDSKHIHILLLMNHTPSVGAGGVRMCSSLHYTTDIYVYTVVSLKSAHGWNPLQAWVGAYWSVSTFNHKVKCNVKFSYLRYVAIVFDAVLLNTPWVCSEN